MVFCRIALKLGLVFRQQLVGEFNCRCVDATSVEWMEQVIITTVLPSAIKLLSFCVGRRPRVG